MDGRYEYSSDWFICLVKSKLTSTCVGLDQIPNQSYFADLPVALSEIVHYSSSLNNGFHSWVSVLQVSEVRACERLCWDVRLRSFSLIQFRTVSFKLEQPASDQSLTGRNRVALYLDKVLTSILFLNNNISSCLVLGSKIRRLFLAWLKLR